MTEGELVELCRRGDREARQEIYARTSGPIYRLLLKMTGDREDAFDLTQETYLRAFTRIGQFDGRCALSTWLYRIAVNEAMRFHRRRRIGTEKKRLIASAERTDHDGEREAERLDVQGALARLGPSDRLVLLLRYEEGLDYRTIAEITGCAEGTVGSRLNRAGARMRRLLGNGYAPPEETTPAGHQKDVGGSPRKAEGRTVRMGGSVPE